MLLDKFQQLEERIRGLLAERDALKGHAEQLKATGGPTEDIDEDEEGLQEAYDLMMRERALIRSRVEGLVGIISGFNKAN